MWTPVKISDGRENFFTPIRIFLALAVLIGHAFVVTGGTSEFEPKVFFHYTASYLAVNLFFIASGFLVTGSMLARQEASSFAAARFLRIYPGLAVHVLLLMFVFGPLTTNLHLGEYLTHPETLKQPAYVLSFAKTEMNLPGIIATNHEQMGSAALWTLRYELLAYIGTLALFMLGLLRRRWMLLAQFVLPSIAYLIVLASGTMDLLPATLQNLLRFGIAYGLGAAIYAYRKHIRLHAIFIPLFVLACFAARGLVVMEIITMIFFAYLVFWAAYAQAPRLKFLQRLTDVSYGIYIYHWAVLQAAYYFWQPSTINLILIALPITWLLSILSWRLVEKPALGQRKALARLLARRRLRTARS